MTKTGGVTRREARKGVKKSKDLMAFSHDVPLSPSPRDHRQRKLASILAGLNHLRAPVVSCLNAFHLWSEVGKKVICTLVTLLFAIPGLDWSNPTDHLELFCGKGEVTMAELEVKRFDWKIKEFGQGMAKCRTRVLKSHGKMARSFARASQLSANKADTRKRVNSAWTKGAQLESVINFLSH
ncbi:unnamed protein product [Cladocopium goreaui]|uniref:Uncharacterized protein n=1 Tax=Cladocopium goreaui TaxID=2562237 RepID=A0A9P1D1F6_9DINO|nr:unnamed protein product [Cladocopium goreaui]